MPRLRKSAWAIRQRQDPASLHPFAWQTPVAGPDCAAFAGPQPVAWLTARCTENVHRPLEAHWLHFLFAE